VDCFYIGYIDRDCVLVYVNVLTSMLMCCLVKKILSLYLNVIIDMRKWPVGAFTKNNCVFKCVKYVNVYVYAEFCKKTICPFII
jgi:hypothetical protein